MTLPGKPSRVEDDETLPPEFRPASDKPDRDPPEFIPAADEWPALHDLPPEFLPPD